VIEAAIKGEAFDVWVPEDAIVPMIYIKDGIRSLIMLSDAPQDQIKTRIYNVGQIWPPPTAKDLVDAVKKFYPEARIQFRPDPAIVSILRTIPRVVEGEKAKEEWRWRISYSLEDMVNDFIENYPG
jgi:nucleoside-diphosphate-sugar epimerase